MADPQVCTECLLAKGPARNPALAGASRATIDPPSSTLEDAVAHLLPPARQLVASIFVALRRREQRCELGWHRDGVAAEVVEVGRYEGFSPPMSRSRCRFVDPPR